MLGFTFFWILFKISISFPAAKKVFKNSSSQQTFILTEGTWTFSLLFFLSITMQTSEFRNPFTISSEYFDMVCYCERPILVLSLLRFSQMTSELITFNHLRCHSSSTALGTRTSYWQPTQRGIDEPPTPQSDLKIEVI